jgi:hypothetical protein
MPFQISLNIDSYQKRSYFLSIPYNYVFNDISDPNAPIVNGTSTIFNFIFIQPYGLNCNIFSNCWKLDRIAFYLGNNSTPNQQITIAQVNFLKEKIIPDLFSKFCNVSTKELLQKNTSLNTSVQWNFFEYSNFNETFPQIGNTVCKL